MLLHLKLLQCETLLLVKEEVHGPHCSPEQHFQAINIMSEQSYDYTRLIKGCYDLTLKKGVAYFRTNLNTLHLRMLCNKFG